MKENIINPQLRRVANTLFDWLRPIISYILYAQTDYSTLTKFRSVAWCARLFAKAATVNERPAGSWPVAHTIILSQQDYPLSDDECRTPLTHIAHVQTFKFFFELVRYPISFYFIFVVANVIVGNVLIAVFFYFFNLFFFFLAIRSSRLGHVWLVFSISFFSLHFFFNWLCNGMGQTLFQIRFRCVHCVSRKRRGKRKRVKLVRSAGRDDGRRCEESLSKLIGNIFVTNYLCCDDLHNGNDDTGSGSPKMARPENWEEDKKNEWESDELMCSFWVPRKFMHPICERMRLDYGRKVLSKRAVARHVCGLLRGFLVDVFWDIREILAFPSAFTCSLTIDDRIQCPLKIQKDDSEEVHSARRKRVSVVNWWIQIIIVLTLYTIYLNGKVIEQNILSVRTF